MFERDDRIYYEKRAAQATELGERATNPKIASLHHELALRYKVLSVQGSRTRPEAVISSRDGRSSPPERAGALCVLSAEPELEQALKQA
jgi:hypothetical protein